MDLAEIDLLDRDVFTRDIPHEWFTYLRRNAPVYRHPEPVFGTKAPYEVEGPVGNVVFGTGLVDLNGRLFLYYGAGDGVIAVATAEKSALFEAIEAVLGRP